MADIKDLDLYGLLELTIDSSEQEIRSAYRKKALKCHPDKNPDDKKAAETFHLLSKALEVLLDKSARDAYDSVIRRKEEVKIRNSKLDSTRKKFKEDLERREKEAEDERQRSYKANKSEEEILQQEIDRLRKEGSIRLQEEIKLIQAEINAAKELNDQNAKLNPENYRLKLKWKTKSKDPSKKLEEYNQEILTKIFSKYGPISILVISPKKPGSALLEFENAQSARRARLYELGLPGNPLQLTFLNSETEFLESKNQPKKPVFQTDIQFGSCSPLSNTGSSEEKTDSNSKSDLFPSFNLSSTINSNKPQSMFPSTNQSSSLFPSASESSNIFSSSQKSSTLFPSASESSNIISSSQKHRNMFPSGLFPSANLSSGLFTSQSNKLVPGSKKSNDVVDYEEAVLNQMRKAQEKQT
uniref:DnaJ homolog subfamily C member 17 n=1 Tax=Cacopsylla melanoneura TaxID=428564 RepID=A0A8D8STU0_9HEMI